MRLTINGRSRELAPGPFESLAATLRERLQLTGTKVGCDRGECGACTVLVDGAPIYACLALTAALDGATVQTVEGLAPPGALHPLQDAFIRHDATQCGYCTPGQLMSAAALLASDPAPSDAAIVRAMSGNLCRCGTYARIVAAVREAAAAVGDRRSAIGTAASGVENGDSGLGSDGPIGDQRSGTR
jgi:xanthine dehydrogenase YagT iron-sulfur-binding subunit